MDDLTIAEVKEEKRKLEATVAQALFEFSDKTGVIVSRLQIYDAVYQQQRETPALYVVSVDMRL